MITMKKNKSEKVSENEKGSHFPLDRLQRVFLHPFGLDWSR